MPYLDPLQTCIVTLSVPVLPSFVNLVSHYLRKTCDKKYRLQNCFNFLSCLCVLAALVVVIDTIVGSNDRKNFKRSLVKDELIAWALVSVVYKMDRNLFLFVQETLSRQNRSENPRQRIRFIRHVLQFNQINSIDCPLPDVVLSRYPRYKWNLRHVCYLDKCYQTFTS